MIYDNILGTIGRTPIVKINRLAPAGTTMYAKCEFFNPLSSVKDRLAIAIIEDAERNGTLKPGQTVASLSAGMVGVDRKLDLFRVINALGPGATVSVGDKVKIITDQ